MASASQDEQSKWCWFQGSGELKDYYFEGMFDLPESEDHTALQLWRHPQFPKLRIHKVTQWVVRTPPKEGEADSNSHLPWLNDVDEPKKMQWLPACMKFGRQEECSPDDVIEIDLMKVAYITMIPEINVTDPNTGKVEQEMGLKIVLQDGTSTEFVGGVYLPRDLMMAAMKKAEENYGKFSGLGQEAKDQASGAEHMKDAALEGWKNTFVDGVQTGVGTGAAGGLGVAATMILAGIPLYGSLMGSILAGASAGLIGGSAVGLALGGVLGTVVGGGSALYDYHKQKQELGLSAVEKMWEKLECHEQMRHCSRTLIVPKGTTCPQL